MRDILQSLAPAEMDRPVAVACGLGLAAVALLLALEYRGGGETSPAEPAVARLTQAQGGVLLRPAGTLAWEPARSGDGLHAHDSIYVPPDAAASVEFAAGPTLEVEERSLVVVEPAEPEGPGAGLALVKGALAGTAGPASLAVRAGSEVLLLDPGSAARLAAGPGGSRLDVLEGRAHLGQAARSAASGVRLEQPARNQRIWASTFPVPVALSWDGAAGAGLLAEAARDAGFTRRIASGPAGTGRLEVELPEAGPWFWRVADAAGRPRSETRRLVVIVDRPPTAFSPMAGEIVLAPPGVQVPFWWTPVDGASRYRVEIAAEPSFRNLALSAAATGPGLWATLDLPEGVYYWRVRVDQAERGSSPPSAPSPFRLIRRPVPDAPRLFDHTIEVEHGAR